MLHDHINTLQDYSNYSLGLDNPWKITLRNHLGTEGGKTWQVAALKLEAEDRWQKWTQCAKDRHPIENRADGKKIAGFLNNWAEKLISKYAGAHVCQGSTAQSTKKGSSRDACREKKRAEMQKRPWTLWGIEGRIPGWRSSTGKACQRGTLLSHMRERALAPGNLGRDSFGLLFSHLTRGGFCHPYAWWCPAATSDYHSVSPSCSVESHTHEGAFTKYLLNLESCDSKCKVFI